MSASIGLCLLALHVFAANLLNPRRLHPTVSASKMPGMVEPMMKMTPKKWSIEGASCTPHQNTMSGLGEPTSQEHTREESASLHLPAGSSSGLADRVQGELTFWPVTPSYTVHTSLF